MNNKQFEDVSVDRNDDFINIKIPIDEIDKFNGNVRIDLPKDKQRINVNDIDNYNFVSDFEDDFEDDSDTNNNFNGYEDNNFGDNSYDNFDAEMAEINGNSDYDFDDNDDIDNEDDFVIDNSENELDTNNVDAYIGAYLASVLASNDIFYIKLNAKGKDFDAIQNFCYLYYTAFNNTELFCKLALEHNNNVPNPSMAKDTLKWNVQNDINYDYNKAVTNLKQIITNYIQYLKNLYDVVDDNYKTEIGNIINQWSIELNYCCNRRTDI